MIILYFYNWLKLTRCMFSRKFGEKALNKKINASDLRLYLNLRKYFDIICVKNIK